MGFGLAPVAKLLVFSFQHCGCYQHWQQAQSREATRTMCFLYYILAENAGTEEHIKAHFRDAIRKTQTMRNFRTNNLVSSTNKLWGIKKKIRKGNCRLKETQETCLLVMLHGLYLNPNSNR